MIFKLREILGVYDQKVGVSGMIGRAFHEALKFYYGGNKEHSCSAGPDGIGEAKQFGLTYLDKISELEIDYGKTGTRESMLKGYTQTMDFYFAEEPTYPKIIMVEEKMESPIKTYDGDELPIPAVGKPDIVYEDANKDVIIEDYKVVTTFTDSETEDYVKIVQAQFLNHLLIATKGIHAKRVDFREIKRSANKDGGPQTRVWSVPLDHEPYRIIFYNLYRDVFKYLSNDPVFLPNLSDPMDGEQAGIIYAQGLINADMSDVEVVHKVREVAFTSKKFVASRLDSPINADLLPEERVKMKLAEFGIPVEPVETISGPSVTQYRFKVSAGVRMSTIEKHAADIVKALKAKGAVRILAPIPGTDLVGVEVEAMDRKKALLTDKDLVAGTLSIPVGVEANGAVVKMPLNEMPHLLVAGTTGSGKSVFLHSTITALTKQMTPEEMQLVLIDPKRVELAAFKTLPHLRTRLIYEYATASKTLQELVAVMESRYESLEQSGKRDIAEYNASKRKESNKLPYIVVVIDEFADLILQSRMGKKGVSKGGDMEMMIVRLAQMARAVGIHLIIATQRPSADVITGLIRANFPTRIALSTASAVESGVIGIKGAEKLSGKGDMLFSCPQLREVIRLQGLVA